MGRSLRTSAVAAALPASFCCCRLADDRTPNAAPARRQVAALVLASHNSLRPWLRDEQEVLKVGMAGHLLHLKPGVRSGTRWCVRSCLGPKSCPLYSPATKPPRPHHILCIALFVQIIGEHMGGRTHALLRFLLRATKFLHRHVRGTCCSPCPLGALPGMPGKRAGASACGTSWQSGLNCNTCGSWCLLHPVTWKALASARLTFNAAAPPAVPPALQGRLRGAVRTAAGAAMGPGPRL